MKPNSLFKGKHTKKALFVIVPVVLCAIIICVLIVSLNDRSAKAENTNESENVSESDIPGVVSDERGDEKDMDKLYERINFENTPSKKTPLNEENMNRIDSAIDELDNRVIELKGDFDNIIPMDDIVLSNNLFDKNSVIENKSLTTNGEIYDAENNWISDKIEVEANVKYYIWGNACIYSQNGDFVGYHSINDAGIYTMPENASYMICTQANAHIDSYYVNKYTNCGKDEFKKCSYLEAKLHGLTVKKNGGGDYTSLTKALWDNVGKGFTIYVDAGEYDLLSEYPKHFGNDIFDASKFDENGDPITNQAWYEGLPIKDTIIYCSPNAVIKFNYDGAVPGLVNWFSPFKFSGNGGELHGGQIICSNCRYAIHDDCYATNNDRRITDGVYIYYRSPRNVAIGGGLGRSSFVEVKNCYIDSTTAGYGIWYHNATVDNAQNFVSIHDNYTTASIEIQTLGPSKLVSKAVVSNNKCHAVNKILYGEVDNFDLVEWNNITD